MAIMPCDAFSLLATTPDLSENSNCKNIFNGRPKLNLKRLDAIASQF